MSGPPDVILCKACGHRHAGRELAFVCIGCPCPERPSPLIDRLVAVAHATSRELVAVHVEVCTGGIVSFLFTWTEDATKEDKAHMRRVMRGALPQIFLAVYGDLP